MTKLATLVALIFIACTSQSKAQEKADFSAFTKNTKALLMKAYAVKDTANYRKQFSTYLAAYNKLDAKEQSEYVGSLTEFRYVMADVYALSGDNKKALDLLERSEEISYDNLLHDHDLDGLRKEPRFVKLLIKAKNPTSKYQATLQKAPKYDVNTDTNVPAFTYQSAGDSNLIALKKAFNLDSIAGKGNDLSQMINLMQWVHYLIPHDGGNGNPKVKNAMSLITECRRDNKTLNCRGLAILLNEVYLAEGFRSKYITCMPKDTTDNDCHVITMVWSASLNKWIWMDPTFMAYVMDDHGTLLSIEEVRERIIGNKPLIINPDANWNRVNSQTKSDYLGYYMSKNLYKLECPLNSQYNYETREEGKSIAYVQLDPGSTGRKPSKELNKHGLIDFTTYYTNCPKTFWAAPPAGPVVAPVARKTQKDYEQVMDQFRVFYNGQKTDSIANMTEDPKEMKLYLTDEEMKKMIADYGAINSCKYLSMEGDDGEVALFKMTCDKSTHVMGISLNGNNKIGSFRFQTSSTYIDKLMAKEQ